MLLGETAVALCVIAVALLGLAMLNGKLPVRRAAQVVLGIFILLGAPVIAGNFSTMWTGGSGREQTAVAVPASAVLYERPALPPAVDDTYARASLRQE